MAYVAPIVDSTGLHIPSYSDIRDDLVGQAKTIFGQDIYLEVDSQDYQWISAVSSKIYDAFQLAQYVYNNRGLTAVGTALDGIVKLNGLKRLTPSYSTATVTITGVSGTVITNGIVSDVSGLLWNLPASVTIPGAGSIEVVATCQQYGSIVADAHEIIGIVTPTYGWTSVDNAVAATPGTSTELDAQLKARQAISTAKPSNTLLEGTKGAIAAVANVTRFEVYENDTNAADANGVTAHSVSAVVEGGTDAAVAQVIFANKGPGVGTYGTTTVNVTDAYGQVAAINFYRPTEKTIDVTIAVKALTGYTTDITTLVKARVSEYLSNLKIGEDVIISSLWASALSALGNVYQPSFSITALTACLHGGSLATTDITIAFNQVTVGTVGYITVNVT